MIGEVDEAADTDLIARGGTREDADDAALELAGGAQEHPALDGAAGDLDEGAVGG